MTNDKRECRNIGIMEDWKNGIEGTVQGTRCRAHGKYKAREKEEQSRKHPGGIGNPRAFHRAGRAGENWKTRKGRGFIEQ
jgi:hypothetical protein